MCLRLQGFLSTPSAKDLEHGSNVRLINTGHITKVVGLLKPLPFTLCEGGVSAHGLPPTQPLAVIIAIGCSAWSYLRVVHLRFVLWSVSGGAG